METLTLVLLQTASLEQVVSAERTQLWPGLSLQLPSWPSKNLAASLICGLSAELSLADVHPLPAATLPVGVMTCFPALSFIFIVLPTCQWYVLVVYLFLLSHYPGQ